MSSAIQDEQPYLSSLYARVDELREHTQRRLSDTLQITGGTMQERGERDSLVTQYDDRLIALRSAEVGLCFGRLDFYDGTKSYVGRLGVLDEQHEAMLLDWRSEAARPFYLATAVAPDGVRRRRHLRTALRKVIRVDDENLDLTVEGPSRSESLVGETALLAAVNANRTGRMGAIVETIQSEQDRIIRADWGGVLVVQGGPGTGKTAVALHRAAYLLYAHRELLARRVVLIVGPNATFLKYIADVLPSLGETSVLLATPAQLFPGVTVTAVDSPEAARVKGSARMANVVAKAIADRQQVPDDAYEIDLDNDTLELRRDVCVRARAKARGTGLPHNRARRIFAEGVFNALAAQMAERIGADVLGGDNLLDADEVAAIRGELRADPAVLDAIEDLWPTLTAQQLIGDLLSDKDRLRSAGLSDDETALVFREHEDWTPGDVPLLDEAAEWLGVDDQSEKERQRLEIAQLRAYAQGALDIAYGSRSIEFEDEESEELSAFDLLDADRLAERYDKELDTTPAERAAVDRTWAFGHIIVDEAQELSEMMWRLLLRRCPTQSMTLVGDVAQTGDLAGTTSWAQRLTPLVGRDWDLAELTVNYRTPSEIMAVAAGVVESLGITAPQSVRSTGVAPWRVNGDDLSALVVDAVRREAEEIDDGRLGVLVPSGLLESVGDAVVSAVPGTAIGADPDLQAAVCVLNVAQAKGLEFDSVIVVEPSAIVAESERGLSDLYVALTRATQRLGVVHTTPLPPELTL